MLSIPLSAFANEGLGGCFAEPVEKVGRKEESRLRNGSGGIRVIGPIVNCSRW